MHGVGSTVLKAVGNEDSSAKTANKSGVSSRDANWNEPSEMSIRYGYDDGGLTMPVANLLPPEAPQETS